MGNLQKPKNIIFILFGLIILCLAYLFITKSNELSPPESVNEYLNVHFIDVGQGDATLLKGPDFTILVDAGRHDRNDVVPYLYEQNVEEIDLLIGTHPHADHIGQFPQVLENFLVNEVWMSGDVHTTRTFEKALDAILETDANYHEPVANEEYTFGALEVEVVHPKENTGSLNNGSIVFRAIYHDVTFLFTGDAERDAELEIVERGHELRSDILKIGHHGSRTSTSDIFLEKVSPKIAVYSAAQNNSYGHPHSETINRLNNFSVEVYGTDINGSVVLSTDGESFFIDQKQYNSRQVYNSGNDCIDINIADKTELTEIVNIGASRAEQIIELRPFNTLDELTMISGIGTNRLSDIHREGKACL